MRWFALVSAACSLALVSACGANHPPTTESQTPKRAEATKTDWGAIRPDLEALFDADQIERKRAMEIEFRATREGHPMSKEQVAELWKGVIQQDAANVAALRRILDSHGWPPMKTVGQKAALGAFLVLQHAPLPVQQHYLPIVRSAAARGYLYKGNLATLEDRVALDEGKAQSYGTQVTVEGGVVTLVAPVEDPDHLDERRSRIGMPPICEYLMGFSSEGPIQWGNCPRGPQPLDAGME